MSSRPANFHGLHIRKWYEFQEETLAIETGPLADGEPVVKLVVAAAIANPNAGRFVASFDEVIAASEHLGIEFARRLITRLAGRAVQSYGKAALVGANGEYEHGNAFLTTAFAEPIREAVGGGKAWVPSTGKRGGPGTEIDIPLAHKDALYVRSHYDTFSVTFTDSPGPDEVVIAMAVATRGRLHARLGGISVDEIIGEDGLR
ncbi:amino acid synthesis family protein [Nitrospirillum viridazoti]|uniref:Peptide synthetase n=1 Tax=Nitrospirillum viridazoti CBAmc TaxID=1441467 RepID=A0A248JUX9_9PROT|nr:amino acid synthesis family protein [Nitrospirillum amazonense]ASG22330.1 peptide synthetase [Nitrospirillum amazonense CBAmc]TWB43140.1 amino acid synthesis protein [Nitrospirillum amazonense]